MSNKSLEMWNTENNFHQNRPWYPWIRCWQAYHHSHEMFRHDRQLHRSFVTYGFCFNLYWTNCQWCHKVRYWHNNHDLAWWLKFLHFSTPIGRTPLQFWMVHSTWRIKSAFALIPSKNKQERIEYWILMINDSRVVVFIWYDHEGVFAPIRTRINQIYVSVLGDDWMVVHVICSQVYSLLHHF